MRLQPPLDTDCLTSSGVAQHILALCPLGLMLTDHGRIVGCNERCARMLGCTPAELLGQRVAQLCPDHTSAHQPIEQAEGAREEVWCHEHLIGRHDGTAQWFRVHGHRENRCDDRICWVFEPLPGSTGGEHLTPREREVLAGLSRGLTAKESARELKLSPRTVEKIRAGLRHKFGARNAVELLTCTSMPPGARPDAQAPQRSPPPTKP